MSWVPRMRWGVWIRAIRAALSRRRESKPLALRHDDTESALETWQPHRAAALRAVLRGVRGWPGRGDPAARPGARDDGGVRRGERAVPDLDRPADEERRRRKDARAGQG